MKLIFSSIILLLFTLSAFAQTTSPAPDAAELTKLLNEFLAGATINDPATHDKIWAEDLVYTGSGGARRGKAEILKSVRSAPPPKPDDPKAVFTAEDIRVQQYGTTAIVLFRLVGTVTDQGETRVSKFYNSATFLKRKGKWQVVNYQVTRIPPSEEDSKKEVAAAEAAYWKAVLAGDAKTVERLTDPAFIWVHHTGEQNDRKKMLDDITSGALKYAKLETENITITVAGDTAVARGTSTRQRVNQNPFTTFYTLVFVNRGGVWKIVSLHTSRVV